MAENEAMEGKDFAKEEQVKAKFEEIITQIINEMENDEATVTLEGVAADININIKKDKEVYKITLFGENIATIDENKEILYNINGLENVKEKLEGQKNPVAKYEDLGLPDIEYLKELEKDKQKEENERENTEKGEEKEENEKDEEEKPDLEDEEKDEQEKQENDNLKKKSNWIKLDLNAEVVKGKTLRDLLRCTEQEAYIAPGKGQYDYSIVSGNNKEGYKLLNSIERTEGRAPNQKVLSIENNSSKDVNEKTPLTMFKCKDNNREGFTISKIGSGIEQVRVEYYRKAYADMYMSSTVPQETADRGIDKPSAETKELMSTKYYSTTDLSQKMDMHKEITEEVNKQNLPDDVNPASDGIQIEELDRETFKQKLVERIIEEERAPGRQAEGYENHLRAQATKMANKILDDNKDYDEAKKEVFGERESGGRTPDQGPRKRDQ